MKKKKLPAHPTLFKEEAHAPPPLVSRKKHKTKKGRRRK